MAQVCVVMPELPDSLGGTAFRGCVGLGECKEKNLCGCLPVSGAFVGPQKAHGVSICAVQALGAAGHSDAALQTAAAQLLVQLILAALPQHDEQPAD